LEKEGVVGVGGGKKKTILHYIFPVGRARKGLFFEEKGRGKQRKKEQNRKNFVAVLALKKGKGGSLFFQQKKEKGGKGRAHEKK